MTFRDRTVIVTGGSEGVGAATARAFAAEGARLMLVARTASRLEALADELRGSTRVETRAMDVADPGAPAVLIEATLAAFGRLDVLVNNAGYHERGPVDSVDAEALGRMIDVNLRAPVVLSRLALPHLRAAGGGAIVNVGSLAGRTPVPGSSVYGASKAGLRAFSYALAGELRGSGVTVGVVSPGPIDTGFIMDDVDGVSDLTFSQPISTADEVAAAILGLCRGRRVEISLPALSGALTALTSVAPWLGRLARPALERRGARVKRRLARERSARGH